ncbi:hypothetical protein Tco_1017702, partial [Tanacetum coccineum]
VIAISVISVSSDSSEDSVGTPVGRVILFDYTPASPDYSPASETESDLFEDPSSDHVPPLLAILPFLSSANDTTNTDTPNTPPLPINAPGQPIPHGRPYRYHPNRPVHMMTARKRVGLLPVQQLAVRHSVDHSSSDYFSLDDSARDSSSDSSSDASSDFHSDASSDSSSRHSLSDHSSPDLLSTFARPSRKRRRSPMTYVPALPLVSEALSPVRADLIPSPKRVKDFGYLADVEVDHRETSLRDDVIVKGSDEPYLEQDIDPEIQAKIDKCFAYANALRDRGIDARVVVEAVDRVESETGARGPVEVRVERVMHLVMSDDIPEPAQEGAVEVTYKTLEYLVQRHRIVGVKSAVTALIERIAMLERDNRRLRDTMPNTRSRHGASRTQEAVNEQSYRWMAEALRVRDLGNGNRGNGDGGNGNRGNENGNGNGNGGEYGYNFRGFMPARECTYQDFLKCQPLNFNGMKGVVGLTRWFEKLETVFHISNCPEKYQVKYASCTLLNSTLTWWNSHKRTIRNEAAYAISWVELRKLTTEVYCPRNEIQKMETKLWNLTVKGNVIAAKPARFQDAVRITNQLMDKKLQGYDERSDRETVETRQEKQGLEKQALETRLEKGMVKSNLAAITSKKAEDMKREATCGRADHKTEFHEVFLFQMICLDTHQARQV